jgi:hypothetical protein
MGETGQGDIGFQVYFRVFHNEHELFLGSGWRNWGAGHCRTLPLLPRETPGKLAQMNIQAIDGIWSL